MTTNNPEFSPHSQMFHLDPHFPSYPSIKGVVYWKKGRNNPLTLFISNDLSPVREARDCGKVRETDNPSGKEWREQQSSSKGEEASSVDHDWTQGNRERETPNMGAILFSSILASFVFFVQHFFTLVSCNFESYLVCSLWTIREQK